MSGRSASPPMRPTEAEGGRAPVGLPRLRLEVLQELQQLIDSRDARDRIDRGPLAETKGREHWVLHLLLRAEESAQSHVDRLMGSSYANLTARLQAVEDRLATHAESSATGQADLATRLEGLNAGFNERIDRGFAEGTERIAETATARLAHDLTERWRPIGDAIETFSVGAKEMVREVSDIYKVTTQTRLLLNENARRISDLGKDIVALEESVKTVVLRAIEDGLAPFDQRLAQVEARLGIPPGPRVPTNPPTDAPPPAPSVPSDEGL